MKRRETLSIAGRCSMPRTRRSWRVVAWYTLFLTSTALTMALAVSSEGFTTFPPFIADPYTRAAFKGGVRNRARSTASHPQPTTTTTTLAEPVSNDIPFVPLTKAFIEMLNDDARYNRYATPTQNQPNTATNVSMSMYIEGISSFSAQTMDYHLDMYFYQAWSDTRLAHDYPGPILIRDKAVFKKLWHPDIYFANAREASFQEITEDNFLVWVYPNGTVWYDCRISLVAICMMNLWKYPLDSQICELRILSYAYPESQLRLRWSEKLEPISHNEDIRMPDMRLVGIKTGSCDGTYATGKWSCMTAVFHVQREMMHHIIQTYVPTALIVVISWFNFWLDIDSAPARVSLSITTLLTIATQANAVKLALPEVSYMKAIDFWLGMCMTFVFAVMVEYTIAHFAKNQDMLHRSIPPNLLVDSTLSTLLGGTPPTDKTVNQETPFARQRKKAKSLATYASQNCVNRATTGNGQEPRPMKHSASATFNAVQPKGRALRPDELDVHALRRHHQGAMLTDYAAGDADLDEYAVGYEEGFDDGYIAESDLGRAFTHDSVESNLTQHERHSGSGMLLKFNSFVAGNSSRRNSEMARLRIPLEVAGDERTIPLEVGGDERTIPLEARCSKSYFRPSSALRLRKQVMRRAQRMRNDFQQLHGREMATKIDEKSRIIFPACFIAVNIFYWSFYLIFN